jgi:hypothetical protein
MKILNFFEIFEILNFFEILETLNFLKIWNFMNFLKILKFYEFLEILWNQYHPESFSSRDDMVEGWYGMWYGKSHIILLIIYLNMRKSCSVFLNFSHVINIILRGMIKGWWYRYQSRQINTVVMFTPW